jgi:2-keto-3-deoxygluconate permease
MADPNYAAVAPAATVQVAASVITTAVLTPILTSFVYKRVQRRRAAQAVAEALQRKPELVGAVADIEAR